MKLPLSSVPVAAHVRARREAAIGQSPSCYPLLPAATCQRLIEAAIVCVKTRRDADNPPLDATCVTARRDSEKLPLSSVPAATCVRARRGSEKLPLDSICVNTRRDSAIVRQLCAGWGETQRNCH